MSQLVTPNLGAAVNIINHWYQPQIVRSVSELTPVWHFHVCPPFQSCRCLCGWSPEWREVMRSNHCSGHRYWPEESSKRRWKTFWRTCRNWEKYEKKNQSKSFERMPHLSRKDPRHWGGASRVAWRVGQRPAGSQDSGLLLRCHNLLCSYEQKKSQKNPRYKYLKDVPCLF